MLGTRYTRMNKETIILPSQASVLMRENRKVKRVKKIKNYKLQWELLRKKDEEKEEGLVG